ncbi:MAG TPA: SCO2322 family protein [Marmoricola sp.]|jgi:hypothetical protein|nr:SCO2322 family protein [Marmoricola sp.]
MNRIASLSITAVRRATLAAVLAAVLGLLVALVLPVAAANAAAYRYWGYYQWDGSAWQFASKGPDQLKPADGAVEGWRFAVTTPDSSRTPRVEATFDEVCGDTAAESGKKRVAVVIDYGRSADSEDGSTPPEPVAECASVDTAATGLEVLGAVADVRAEKGLVCGLDGYPASGCGGEVKTVSAAAQAPDQPVELAPQSDSADTSGAAEPEDDGVGTGTWIGIGVVVVALAGLGTAAVLRRRQA